MDDFDLDSFLLEIDRNESLLDLEEIASPSNPNIFDDEE
jgi:hypothetical protein